MYIKIHIKMASEELLNSKKKKKEANLL